MNTRIATYLVLLLMLSLAAPVKGENGKEPTGPSGQNRQSKKDGVSEREIACGCCKICKAAKKEVQGKEEGPPAKNGCQDCCSRCGSTELQDQRKLPPEIVK